MENMVQVLIILAFVVVLLMLEVKRRRNKKQQAESIIADTQKRNKRKRKRKSQVRYGNVKFSIRPIVKPEDKWAKNYMKELRSQKQISFFSKLEEIMQNKGLCSVDVYKKADIDRRLFSKLKKDDYHPRKKTVLALALAMELTLEETEYLLLLSGFALAPNRDFDLIVRDCIQKQIYDLIEVNKILYRCTNETI